MIAIHSVDAVHQHNRFYQSYKIPDKKGVGLEKSLRPIRTVFELLELGNIFGAYRASNPARFQSGHVLGRLHRPVEAATVDGSRRNTHVPPRLTSARSPKAAGLPLCAMYERQLRDGNPLSSYPLCQSLEKEAGPWRLALNASNDDEVIPADNAPRWSPICIECHRSWRGNLRDVSRRRSYRDNTVVIRRVCTHQGSLFTTCSRLTASCRHMLVFDPARPNRASARGAWIGQQNPKHPNRQQSLSTFNRRSQEKCSCSKKLHS